MNTLTQDAEAIFMPQRQGQCGLEEYHAKMQALRERTARLRELRMAKEAAAGAKAHALPDGHIPLL